MIPEISVLEIVPYVQGRQGMHKNTTSFMMAKILKHFILWIKMLVYLPYEYYVAVKTDVEISGQQIEHN